jgi:Tol biopolymer transport system component
VRRAGIAGSVNEYPLVRQSSTLTPQLDSDRFYPLLQTRADEWFDSWSPEGKKFLVESDVGHDFDIYVLDTPRLGFRWSIPDPVVLDDDSAAQGFARWSPDGKQIAFAGNGDGTGRSTS